MQSAAYRVPLLGVCPLVFSPDAHRAFATVQGAGFRTLGSGYWFRDVGFRVQSFEFRVRKGVE
jgi:hypothetical protein